MRSIILAICILAMSFVSAQTKQVVDVKEKTPSISEIKTEPVNIGYSFNLHSDLLNEDRTIKVYLPDGYASSTKNFPVFYLVDAQWNFNLTVNAISVLANNGLIPPMIVVGVNTIEKREWDLLPTRFEPNKAGGGADKLHEFIKDELIPFVDKNYKTDSYRLLAGSSFGGVFVMHALVTDHNLFNAYLTLSPSMWWDNKVMLKRTEGFLLKNAEVQNHLYVSVANEGLGMGVNELADILKAKAPKNLLWKFDEYPEEVHGTICYKSTYNGLKFIFADWSNKPVEFQTKGGLLSSNDSVIVTLNSKSKTIRYTLDGSNPTNSSPLYEKPIKVTKPQTIKALPYYNLELPGIIDSLRINYVTKMSTAKKIHKLKSGMKYSYYEGNWDKLPDYDKLTPVSSGITKNFKSGEAPRQMEFFGVRFTGYIEIPKEAVYTFYLLSDDGSKLIIGDKEIINNDGLHGNVELREQVYLQKGKYPFTVLFFQKAGGLELVLQYESDEISKQPLPDTVFYYPEE